MAGRLTSLEPGVSGLISRCVKPGKKPCPGSRLEPGQRNRCMTRDKRLFNIWRPARSSADCQASPGLWASGTSSADCEGTPGRCTCLDGELGSGRSRSHRRRTLPGTAGGHPCFGHSLLASSSPSAGGLGYARSPHPTLPHDGGRASLERTSPSGCRASSEVQHCPGHPSRTTRKPGSSSSDCALAAETSAESAGKKSRSSASPACDPVSLRRQSGVPNLKASWMPGGRAKTTIALTADESDASLPRRDRDPRDGGQAFPDEPGLTSFTNPAIRYSVPEKPYVVLRRGEVEAVVVDNRAVDDGVCRASRRLQRPGRPQAHPAPREPVRPSITPG